MTITVTHSLPEEKWRCFVEGHPAGNIFHTPEMFQVFEKSEGHQPKLWAAVDENDSLLALLIPVRVTVLDGPLAYFTSRSVVYGGVLCKPTRDGQTALDYLLTIYNQEVARETLFTEIRNLVDAHSIQDVFQKCDYSYQPHDNFLINLNLPIDAVWNNIHKSARKVIRRTLKKNELIIEEVQNSDQLQIWYTLLQKTYKMIRVPLAKISVFEAAFDILFPKGMGQFLLGRVGDTYIAASVALLYKDVIYGWYRGFDRDYASCLPNDLMVWHLLKWGVTNGYHTFDFGGAGRPDEDYGPRKFKAKFGGTLVNYGRNTCVHAPTRLKFSQKGYQLVRRFI